MSRSALAARLQVLAAAVLFSTGGAAIKATALSGWQVAGLRSGVAALLLVALVPAARRIASPRVLAVGVAYAAALVCYALANRLTTAANTIFLQSTAPLYIAVLAPWLLRERLRRRDLLLLAVMAAGLVPFFLAGEPASRTAPDPLAGNLLAAAAGISWALVVIGLRAMERRPGQAGSAIASVVAGNGLAFLATLPFALPLPAAAPADWAIVVYLGAVQIGLAYLLLTAGLGRVPAFEASLLLLAEPVLNPLWAWLVHGERPARWALVGGAVILGATAARLLAQRRPAGRSAAAPDAGSG